MTNCQMVLEGVFLRHAGSPDMADPGQKRVRKGNEGVNTGTGIERTREKQKPTCPKGIRKRIWCPEHSRTRRKTTKNEHFAFSHTFLDPVWRIADIVRMAVSAQAQLDTSQAHIQYYVRNSSRCISFRICWHPPETTPTRWEQRTYGFWKL